MGNLHFLSTLTFVLDVKIATSVKIMLAQRTVPPREVNTPALPNKMGKLMSPFPIKPLGTMHNHAHEQVQGEVDNKSSRVRDVLHQDED